MTLLYHMRTMPALHGVEDLPWQNRVLAGLFVRFDHHVLERITNID